MRPGTEKRNISEENVDDLILASNEEIILNPHIYTRLTAIDFYVILMWVRQGKKILDQFKNQVFYFSTSSLVNAEKVKVRQMKKRRHYICMEKDLNRDTWIYHIRDIAWIKRPHGHKIICLKNIK
jgi:hypothetical protein